MYLAEESSMTANKFYDPMSLLSFQVSMLSLAAALDDREPVGSKEHSALALGEAERLKQRCDQDWR